jgi:transmembrane sensor
MGQEDQKAIWNLIAKKLAGETSPDEIQELERLLKYNPELHYPMQAIIDLWNSSAKSDRNEAELAFSRHIDRMKEGQIDFPEPAVDLQEHPFSRQSRPNSRLRKFILSLSLTIGVGLLTALIWPSHRTPQQAPTPVAHHPASAGNDIYTANGSRTHLTLPDGTLVWLNAGSRLSYGKNFNTMTREVSLTGEAFFDVARNTQKPFLIHTARIDVRVLGTRFDVKSYPADSTTETLLIRGSIEVALKGKLHETLILRPNEKLIVRGEDSVLLRQPHIQAAIASVAVEPHISICQPTYQRNTGAIVETSWINDKLVFQDEKFSELALKLERWYGVNIRFADPSLEGMRLTGTFRNETVREALDAMRLTARFSYTINDNQITIADEN